MPILPLCYTTPERDAKQTALPKADGYLYIFVEGRLWRELRSVGRGFYKDVNLAELAGEDEREPTGEPDARILVPYRIDGEPVTVEMCYAHVQWSWERINSMGGLAEEHIGDTPPPMPTDEQLAEAEALRALRMRRLDLSGYAERFPERAPDEQCAGVRNITDVVHLHALKWLQRAQIPVVELDDHLGIVTKLAENYQTAWAEMGKLLEDLRNPEHEGEKANEFPFAPWFDSALLANRYFFADFPDPELEGVAERPGQPSDLEREWKKAKEQREEWQSQLSYDDIQLALGVERRKALRERIKETKAALVQYLDTTNPELDNLIAAIDDYATLPAGDPDEQACYAHLFLCVQELVAKLGDHEYSMDLELEVSAPNPVELTEQDIGHQLLGKILDPDAGHPLHERLIPPAAEGEDRLAPNMAIQPPGSPKANPNKLLQTGQKGMKLVGDLIDNFAKAADLIENETRTQGTVRLINSTASRDLLGQLEYQTMTVGEYANGQTRDGRFRVVSAYVAEINEEIRDTRREMRARLRIPDETLEIKGGGSVRINVYDKKGNLMGASSAEAFRQGHGLSTNHFVRQQTYQNIGDGLRETNVNVIVVRDPGRLAEAGRQLRDTRVIANGIYPILLAIEGWNLANVTSELLDKGASQAELTTFMQGSGAIINFAAVTAGLMKARYEALGVDASPGTRANRVNLAARRLGTAGGIYSTGSSLYAMEKALRRGDDAAIAYGTIALGSAISTAATLGMGAKIGAALIVGVKAKLALALIGGIPGLIGVAIILAGYALLTWVFTEDTPLEEWLTNGPFSVNGLRPRRHIQTVWRGRERAHVWRDRLNGVLMTSVYVRASDDVLLSVQEAPPLTQRRVGRTPRLYQQGEQLFLRKGTGSVPIGRIGEPFSFDVLEVERSQRFAGHLPGDTPHDKFGWWYERPETAYLALHEAIYMPAVDLRCKALAEDFAEMQHGEAVITVHFPLLLQNRSRVFVELWMRKSGGLFNMGAGDWEKLQEDLDIFREQVDGPQTVIYQWQLPRGQAGEYELKAKVRVDLYGDGEVVLPALPASDRDQPELGEDQWIEAEDKLRLMRLVAHSNRIRL
ncbi:hypothetical protein [Alkalilimnicola ehrlichii]|uniref:hypothetical protein n=1 Tax=Alkalilimnicola ehrlichii TaxID=351052 RepID=UPI0011C04B68|nr:hypothetical protein [Alkalilimnicola ehrlichii]